MEDKVFDNRVFVYGTLQGTNPQRGLNMFPGAVKVGNATTTDGIFNLYDLGAFPAMTVVEKGYNVSGEVWEVDDKTAEYLDQIEGYPDFYSKSEISTSLGDAVAYHIKDIQAYNAMKISPEENGVATWTSQWK